MAVLENAPSAIVVRTNFFARSQPGGKGLIDFVIKSAQFSKVVFGYRDVLFNPVGAHFLAKCLEKLISSDHQGIMNISSSRLLSKYEFLCLVVEKLNLNKDLIQARDSSHASNSVLRPKCMSLNPSKLRSFLGEDLPTIESQLDTELSGTIPLLVDKDGK